MSQNNSNTDNYFRIAGLLISFIGVCVPLILDSRRRKDHKEALARMGR